MFINFSNHPSSKWDEVQLNTAKKLSGDGNIIDIPFPRVDPAMTAEQVLEKARECVKLILSHSPDIVMCQGEFTLSYHVINTLKENGVKVVAACSNRMVKEQTDGTKIVEFKFEQFREY